MTLTAEEELELAALQSDVDMWLSKICAARIRIFRLVKKYNEIDED
jgi:hypothetical protein